MSDQDDEPDLVRISLPGPAAVSEPIFLIKVGEVYYATLGVWEYDLAKATTEDQREGYRQVETYFRQAGEGETSPAITLKIGDPPTMTSTTRPPHPKPIPTSPHRAHSKPSDPQTR